MNNTGGTDISRNEYLFHHLVAMFQTLALQQLGKFINPVTGKVERDLQQARITIDMIQMIKEKTAGNLSSRERGLLDGVLTELQLNYVDELKREEPEPQEKPAAGAEEEKKAEQAADEREQGTAEPVTEKPGAEEAGAAPPPPGKKMKKPKAAAKKTKSDPEAGK
ncbi:MAG TPA: DUF1844 domain-containing protein [Patescibacteria group bacterium]|nr:DUF1844 domain-containing protein [Patescibacteria group bacterium]